MMNAFAKLDFGPYSKDAEYRREMITDVIIEKVYEKFRSVRPGDIVLDIGANIGAFPVSLENSRPSHVICVEPSNHLIAALNKNTSNLPFKTTILNCGIGSGSGVANVPSEILAKFMDSNQTTMSLRSIQDIVGQIGKKIDFMKIDCEGGEYDLFTSSNYEFIRRNVSYIAGEFHVSTKVEDSLRKFMSFRDVYLNRGRNNFRLFEICHTPPNVIQSTGCQLSHFWKEVTEECQNDDSYPERFQNWFQMNANFMLFIDNTIPQ